VIDLETLPAQHPQDDLVLESSATPPDIPDRAIPPRPSMQRLVLTLAGPVIGEMLLETTLGIVDTLLVSRLGADALAGVGGALQVMFFLISTLSALAIGSSVLVAQAVGARNPERASHFARQSLIWSVICSMWGRFLIFTKTGICAARSSWR